LSVVVCLDICKKLITKLITNNINKLKERTK